jgi:hypothetical protein
LKEKLLRKILQNLKKKNYLAKFYKPLKKLLRKILQTLKKKITSQNFTNLEKKNLLRKILQNT